ncbi:MAG TPA: alpha/beta hydrolase-fold protein, partial [Microlunatus sp.]|nr:alpha/beta hydrolase-fold protein [Microlunatus sp.]
TQLNAQFLFFAGWSDLQGALGGNVATTSVARGAQASAAAERKVAGPAATSLGLPPPLPAGAAAKGLLSYTVKGPLSGITASVVVQLPPGYSSPANARERYPVIETFGGYPGVPAQFMRTLNLGGLIADAVSAHQMRSALLVAPQVQIPLGVDTECVNGEPSKPQIETWLAEDVPNWIARTFRINTERSSWATMGLSAGGWCAAMATMLHPAQYSAAVVLGGYFHPDFGPYYEAFPKTSPLETRYDLVKLSSHPPPVALWLETSHADALSYSSSARLLHTARPPMAVNAVVLQQAGHRTSVWKAVLPTALLWLGHNIPGFRPG